MLYNLIYGNTMTLQADVLLFTQEVWGFLLLATFIALSILLIGRKFNRIKALLLLAIYLLFLLFVVTQIESVLPGIGKNLGAFLSKVAVTIGEILH
jgi:Ca2+/Na+ antiporter